MKTLSRIVIPFILSFFIGFFMVSAEAKSLKGRTKKKTAVVSQIHSEKAYGGEALRPKRSLEFDGRTVESMGNGRYDSVSYAEEDQSLGGKKLYSLPKNFQSRTRDAQSEVRVLQ